MKHNQKPNVFNYTNYRKYLGDYFNEQKKTQNLTYRIFARRAGVNSSGLLKDVISGRSNIQSSVIIKFSKGIGHSKREAVYFENLVYFNQANSIQEKNHYFQRMMRLHEPGVRKVHKGQYEFYSRWYYTAIRDLLSTTDFKDDYKTLCRKLRPPITALEAKRAIKILLKSGFIKKDGNGFFRAAQPNIPLSPEVKALHVANYQRSMMDLAKEAIDRSLPDEKDISIHTFTVSPKAVAELKAEISASRARMMDIIRYSKNATQVYQLNLQLYPLSGKG